MLYSPVAAVSCKAQSWQILTRWINWWAFFLWAVHSGNYCFVSLSDMRRVKSLAVWLSDDILRWILTLFSEIQWPFLFESFRSLCNFSPYSMFLCVFINEKNFKISRVLSCIICPSYLIYCILSEKGKKKPRHFLGKIMCTLRRITTTFNFILEKWKKLV